jgi:hypothetical protein
MMKLCFFSINGRTPISGLFIVEDPLKIWMRTEGIPFLGTPHMALCLKIDRWYSLKSIGLTLVTC